MILAMSIGAFTAVHVVLSLIGLASGIIVLGGCSGRTDSPGGRRCFSSGSISEHLRRGRPGLRRVPFLRWLAPTQSEAASFVV